MATLTVRAARQRRHRRVRGKVAGTAERPRLVVSRSNRGIAARLAISIKTVETHREHINHKVGAHNTADLVRWAARNGLLDRDEVETPELAGQGL